MNLCIDIGNTTSKASLFERGEEIEHIENFGVADFNRIYNSQQVIISKTGSDPELEEVLKENNAFNVVHYSKVNSISLDYSTPETLGTDRLAVAVAVHDLYPNDDVAVLDIGTCITLDLVEKEGVFKGGLIAPGIEMRLKAMHEFTSNLPLAEINENVTFPGKSTKESMQVGAYQSVKNELIGYFSSLAEQYQGLIVVDCSKRKMNFDKGDNYKIFAHPKMVLKGLNLIAEQYV